MNNNKETHLQPIRKQKFTNIALFERGERENLALLSKPPQNTIQLSKVKIRQSKGLGSFYITEKQFQKTETDKMSTNALTYQTLMTEPIVTVYRNSS